MQANLPLVSIGIPVYNGENFITKAIESILCQTFTNFELIICDNGSTDSTSEICLNFAKTDQRIQYLTNSENIGAAANFNKVFSTGRTKYFKWAAHDDELEPHYLTRCIEILEQDETVVLCHSQVNVIDGRGVILRHDATDITRLQSHIVSQRFNSLIRNDLDNYEVFGVIRREVLARTPLIDSYIASDRTLRAELGLHGKFIILAEPLFLCRHHPMRSICAMPAHHQRAQWFDPNIKDRCFFPHWRIFSEYFKSIARVKKLTFLEKLACRLAVIKWLGVHQNWARLIADILLVMFPNMEGVFIRYGNKLIEKGDI